MHFLTSGFAFAHSAMSASYAGNVYATMGSKGWCAYCFAGLQSNGRLYEGVQPVRCGSVVCRVRYLHGREVTSAEVDAFAKYGSRTKSALPTYMVRLESEVLREQPTADAKPRKYTLTEKWPGAGKRASRRVSAGDKKRKEEVAAGDKKRKEEPPAEEESNKRQDRGDAPVDQLDYF